MKIDLIVPFCKMDNIINLRKIIEWASGFSGFQITIVEYGENSILESLSFKCKIIFLKSKFLSKSWALNVATKKTNNNIIIYCNPNCIMNPDILINSINNINNFDCILPINKYRVISQNEESIGLYNIFNLKDNLVDLDELSLFVIKRESFMKISGWCESLSGNELMEFQLKKIRLNLNYKSEENVCYIYPNYVNNTKSPFYEGLIKLNNSELIQHINFESPKIGIKNRI
jgi:hypothetical protein